MWLEQGRELARVFKQEIVVYQRVLRDARTPMPARLFLGLAVGYFLMPFDLVPDFIPVLGHLDDLVIIPALIFIALRFVSADLVSEHRERFAREQESQGSKQRIK
jgi:uncharacterized membrane protein YkvA (DUF1232 family)